jgi:PAS domain S-box-containing protein
MQTVNVPIKNKLIRLILATSLGVLGVMCLALFLYDRHQYRKMMPRSFASAARIVAGNSARGLIADDPQLVAEILASITGEPDVVAAALYDQTGRIAATIPATAPRHDFPAAPGADGVTQEAGAISIFEPVMKDDLRVGTLYLKGSFSEAAYQSLSTYGAMLLGIATCAAVLALLWSSFLRRRISDPLAALSATARAVSTDKDYSLRAIKVSADEFGQLTDAFNLMLDEIQKGNAALQAGEERFRTLADNMAQLAWMAEPDGSVTWYNKRWYDYTGRGPLQPMEGQNDLVHSEHAERVATKFRRCIDAGEVWQDTFPLRARDGTHRWFLAHALPIRGAYDKVIRWFCTNTDVTELRETQQELRRTRDEAIAASHAKDEFLATLSHELRTPLNPVLLLVSDPRRVAELPVDVREDFETIRKHVELEARLIDDMLDLTSITRGKVVLNLRPLSLHDILRDALKTVDADRAAKRISVAVELDPREPVVMGDAVRLQQVLWNIIKNAIKFSAPGGTVTVRSRLVETDGTWTIDVIDRGIGMLPSEIARAFDAFVQGDHAAGGGSHRFGGLGLGLAISRKLMELHDGHITASSAGMGQGSTFTITIPMLRAERATEVNPNGERRASVHPFNKVLRQLRILLVEDHNPTRLALERLLIRRGHRVAAAASLAEARTLARRNQYDVLVSDIGLPDGTGYELMIELRHACGIVGLALTGYGTEGDIALAKDAGFLAHLTKPIRTELLEDGLNLAITTLSPGDRE